MGCYWKGGGCIVLNTENATQITVVHLYLVDIVHYFAAFEKGAK